MSSIIFTETGQISPVFFLLLWGISIIALFPPALHFSKSEDGQMDRDTLTRRILVITFWPLACLAGLVALPFLAILGILKICEWISPAVIQILEPAMNGLNALTGRLHAWIDRKLDRANPKLDAWIGAKPSGFASSHPRTGTDAPDGGRF